MFLCQGQENFSQLPVMLRNHHRAGGLGKLRPKANLHWPQRWWFYSNTGIYFDDNLTFCSKILLKWSLFLSKLLLLFFKKILVELFRKKEIDVAKTAQSLSPNQNWQTSNLSDYWKLTKTDHVRITSYTFVRFTVIEILHIHGFVRIM